MLAWHKANPHQLLQDIGGRQESFLSTKKWVHTPWHNATKNDKDTLFDLIAMVPGLFARSDRILASEPSQSSEQASDELHWSLVALIDSLHDWRAGLAAGHEGVDVPLRQQPYPIPSPGLNPPNLDPEPEKQRHPDAAAAELLALCATMHLMLNLELSKLHHNLAERSKQQNHPRDRPNSLPKGLLPSVPSTLLSESFMLEAGRYADNILDLMEIMLDSKAGALAASNLVFPIMVVATFLRLRGDSRLEYIRRRAKQYQERSGVPLAVWLADCTGRTNEQARSLE